jgi:hypothetical protein
MRYAIFSLVALILPGLACGADPSILPPKSTTGQTPTEHMPVLNQANSLSGSQPIGVLIEGWLPGTDQSAKLEGVRQNSPDREHFKVVKCEGDAAVLAELIAPYITGRHSFDDESPSSVLVKPASYNYHYEGKTESQGNEFYTFEVAPKTKEQGLVRGKLWIDSMTGLAVVQTGSVEQSGSRDPEFVRTTALMNGQPFARTTLVSFETQAGRGYVKVTELALAMVTEEAPTSSQ